MALVVPFAVEPALMALIDKSKIGDAAPLLEFLEKEQIDDTECFALICEQESEVVEAIVKKAGYDANILKNVVCIKKIWRWARQACEQVSASGSMPAAAVGPPQDDEAPLSKGTRERVDKCFYEKWGFSMPGFRLATDSWFNKLYRQMNDKPRRLEVVHLENVRLQSAISSNELKGTLVSGSSVHEFRKEVSEVSAHHDLWLRANAVFSTLCLVMAETPH